MIVFHSMLILTPVIGAWWGQLAAWHHPEARNWVCWVRIWACWSCLSLCGQSRDAWVTGNTVGTAWSLRLSTCGHLGFVLLFHWGTLTGFLCYISDNNDDDDEDDGGHLLSAFLLQRELEALCNRFYICRTYIVELPQKVMLYSYMS